MSFGVVFGNSIVNVPDRLPSKYIPYCMKLSPSTVYTRNSQASAFAFFTVILHKYVPFPVSLLSIFVTKSPPAIGDAVTVVHVGDGTFVSFLPSKHTYNALLDKCAYK